jgi:hypothetical protein
LLATTTANPIMIQRHLQGTTTRSLEHFPSLWTRTSVSENALAICIIEHFYPTGDPIRSDNALAET